MYNGKDVSVLGYSFDNGCLGCERYATKLYPRQNQGFWFYEYPKDFILFACIFFHSVNNNERGSLLQVGLIIGRVYL